MERPSFCLKSYWTLLCALPPVKVVCAHAVSVPPTPQLSAHTTGYLPVHCVHQLIKTRTFRKYGISIKVGRGVGRGVGYERLEWEQNREVTLCCGGLHANISVPFTPCL